VILIISSKYIYFLYTGRPTAVLKIYPDHQVFRGERVTLRCDLQGGGGFEWTYSWYKEGNTDYLYSSTQQYEISSVEYFHSGKYVCIGTVRGTSHYSHTSAAVTLTVSGEYLPRATLDVDPDSTVFTGESVTLKCEITGYDRWRYQWYKGSISPYSSKQEYKISSVEYSHSGKYTCRGRVRGTSRYSHTSTAVTLTVSGECDHLYTVLKIYPANQVFRGERVTLRCDLQGGGGFVWTYSWYKEGNPVSPFSSSQQYEISSVEYSHSGEYSCRGRVRGTSRYSHYSPAVTLTVSERPKPVVTINPANQVFRGESVTLRCDLRGGGGFDWTYSWYKKGNTVSLYSSTQDYEISSVSDSHRGEYTCIGTVRGTSRYSHTSTAVRLTVSGHSSGASVALGVSLGLSLLFLIILGLICYYKIKKG
uniref:Ig-like domain-containing protein n=1 Tax=Astyanax mexicanus TaxID=7994 RepID=W5L4A1_ASTMX